MPALMRSICCAVSTAAICEDACPTEAIVLGDNYELSFTDRRDAIYTKDTLLEAVPSSEMTTPQKVEPGLYTRSVPQMENPRD
jgi:NADH-quinone oxidoreductase subunit I